ncbi:Uncharacterised protein [Serratia marcescens]|nr:Uncharacterised protein [Serratia marcescens]CUZ51584.1 Uncharacterised protein [Serratia marcescens]CVC28200.1 Uncharacterised protein [Serratia marcescens]CVD62455.1 Uncharacterised protein [Serratia marcescens]
MEKPTPINTSITVTNSGVASVMCCNTGEM